MQHRDMLPFSITYVIENEGNGKSTFFVSVSKNAREGIFRSPFNYPPRQGAEVMVLERVEGAGPTG